MLRVHRYIYVNGEWVDAAEAWCPWKIAVTNSRTECTKWCGCTADARSPWRRIERLARSAAQLELDLPLEAGAIGGLIREAPGRRGVGRRKCTSR